MIRKITNKTLVLFCFYQAGRMNENPKDSSTWTKHVLQEAQKWRQTLLDTRELVN